MAKKRFALFPEEREKECTQHLASWTGKMPCTGRYMCHLCGEDLTPARPKKLDLIIAGKE